ncbi:hypothetical protein CIY_08520 [Butyrivibrio fibrisolvens 16/4]|jgi:hypothetical protein|nr:hypothetical protein CIY_08520 [Butyrivibrio fibrisolvens 16/4]
MKLKALGKINDNRLFTGETLVDFTFKNPVNYHTEQFYIFLEDYCNECGKEESKST